MCWRTTPADNGGATEPERHTAYEEHHDPALYPDREDTDSGRAHDLAEAAGGSCSRAADFKKSHDDPPGEDRTVSRYVLARASAKIE